MERTLKPSSLLFIPFLLPSVRIVFNFVFVASVDGGPSVDAQPRDDWSENIFKKCNIFSRLEPFRHESSCTHVLYICTTLALFNTMHFINAVLYLRIFSVISPVRNGDILIFISYLINIDQYNVSGQIIVKV